MNHLHLLFLLQKLLTRINFLIHFHINVIQFNRQILFIRVIYIDILIEVSWSLCFVISNIINQYASIYLFFDLNNLFVWWNRNFRTFIITYIISHNNRLIIFVTSQWDLVFGQTTWSLSIRSILLFCKLMFLFKIINIDIVFPKIIIYFLIFLNYY